jgi:hypothetical protein
MKLSRFRGWLLLLVIALVALAGAGSVLVGRARIYSSIAEALEASVARDLEKAHALEDELNDRLKFERSRPATKGEDSDRRIAIEGTARLSEQIRRIRASAMYYQRRAMEHRRAARYPWLRPRWIEPLPDDAGLSEPRIIR